MGAPPRSKVTAEQLIVRVLGAGDASLVQTFTCGEADLDDFVRTDALRLQTHGVVRCYLAFFGAELVGYMAVLSDAIVLETKERKRLALGAGDHPIVPAVKIARLGVSEPFRRMHAGVGTALVHIAHAMALDIADRVGCRLLTVDAYPESVAFYERLGFVPNRAKPYRDREHPSMRLDILLPAPPSWAT